LALLQTPIAPLLVTRNEQLCVTCTAFSLCLLPSHALSLRLFSSSAGLFCCNALSFGLLPRDAFSLGTFCYEAGLLCRAPLSFRLLRCIISKTTKAV
jgi:hypothetical protein